jgi:hypothetical protein
LFINSFNDADPGISDYTASNVRMGSLWKGCGRWKSKLRSAHHPGITKKTEENYEKSVTVVGVPVMLVVVVIITKCNNKLK